MAEQIALFERINRIDLQDHAAPSPKSCSEKQEN